jgi:hypothetical protein
MTKKDYVRIAAALARNTPGFGSYSEHVAWGSASKPDVQAWSRIVTAIADVLAADNPRFDRARFYKACGMEG